MMTVGSCALAFCGYPKEHLMPCPHVQILDGAEYGIDVFDTAYATVLAAAGHALALPLHPASLQPHSAANSPSIASTPIANGHAVADAAQAAESSTGTVSSSAARGAQQNLHIDFSDVALREDKAPLQQGCSCYTCSNHSRAYLHHLVQSKELLAPVLLQMHNIHQMQSWFAVLRSAIAAGEFGQYAAWFRTTFHVPAPVVRTPLANAVSVA